MAVQELRGFSFWHCPECQGLWLPFKSLDFAIGQGRFTAKESPASKPLACPEDGADLGQLRHHGVEIDFCTKCGGVWLDAGELEHILQLKQAPGLKRAPLKKPASDAWDLLNVYDSIEITADFAGTVLEFLAEALTEL